MTAVNQGHMEFCTSTAWQEILGERILPGALARVDLGPEVIEIGPGPGFTTEVLLTTSEHVTAVEIDPLLVSQLRDRLSGANVDVIVGDARETELAPASFSGAASFHMLHHIATDEDQDRIFTELRRVLRPGGVVLLADGYDAEEVRKFHEGDTYNPIDTGSLPERLTRAGFAEIEVERHELGWYCTGRARSGGRGEA
jgi:SAM-dependent methyltransferase